MYRGECICNAGGKCIFFFWEQCLLVWLPVKLLSANTLSIISSNFKHPSLWNLFQILQVTTPLIFKLFPATASGRSYALVSSGSSKQNEDCPFHFILSNLLDPGIWYGKGSVYFIDFMDHFPAEFLNFKCRIYDPCNFVFKIHESLTNPMLLCKLWTIRTNSQVLFPNWS